MAPPERLSARLTQRRGSNQGILITHFWPGATEDRYNATVRAVHPPGGLPDGQIYHAAGPTEGGILIAAVWDSKEHADRFVQDKLLASMPIAGGVSGQPEERAAEIVNLMQG
jgi:hypothetical protein